MERLTGCPLSNYLLECLSGLIEIVNSSARVGSHETDELSSQICFTWVATELSGWVGVDIYKL